jgi:hypothetical protein
LDSSALLKQENSPQTPRHSQATGPVCLKLPERMDPSSLLGGKQPQKPWTEKSELTHHQIALSGYSS